VGAWAPVNLFFQNDQKGEGNRRKSTALRKPEKVPSSKDRFQADTGCCLAEIRIVCVRVWVMWMPEQQLHFLCWRGLLLAWLVCFAGCCSSSAFRANYSISGIFSRGLGLFSVLKVLEGG